VRRSYTRDGNETADENRPQRIPYIDYCGHADSRVWGEDSRSKEDGEEFLSGYILHMAHGGFGLVSTGPERPVWWSINERAHIGVIWSVPLVFYPNGMQSRPLFDLESNLARRPGTPVNIFFATLGFLSH